ncbi:MAG TPA: hypothetical protein VF193_14155 [Steroidobacter sp.]
MKPRLWQQRNWMLALMTWVGILSWIPGIYYLQIGAVSPWWFVASAVTYHVIGITVSVGYHRLFVHHAFKCRPFWHWTFALLGVLTWYGSPIQWVALHTTHHRFSDRDGDPHYTGWSYVLWKRYKPVKLDLWRTRRLLKSRFHLFVHNYYVLLALGAIAALYLISPTLLLFGYLMPFGLLSTIGSIHVIVSHRGEGDKKEAIDLPIMEYLVPFMGEWNHGKHHREPGAWDLRMKWWHLDPGALVIKAIRQ